MKKVLSFLMMAILLVSFAGNVVAEEKKDVTLSFMASQDWIWDPEYKLIEQFTAETGIKVDFQIVPSDQYFNLLMTRLNNGECTDLFGYQSNRFDNISQINAEKNCVDLSDQEWVTRLAPHIVPDLSVNGKVYGQPINDLSATWAMAYNKNIFADLNLEIPTTWDEFIAVCEAIKTAGITPVYESVQDGWHHTLWFTELCVQIEEDFPGTAAKLSNNEITFADNEQMILMLNQYNDMVKAGYWGDEVQYMSNMYVDTARSILSGEYAMTVYQQGLGGEIQAIDPSFDIEDIGYFVIPLGDNQVINANPSGPTRMIYSGSKHIEEAKMYLEWMARAESIDAMIDGVPKFNTLQYEGAKDKYPDSVREFFARYEKTGVVYQVAVSYVNPQWYEIGKEMTALLTGQQTVEGMLKAIDKNREVQAITANDPNWVK